METFQDIKNLHGLSKTLTSETRSFCEDKNELYRMHQSFFDRAYKKRRKRNIKAHIAKKRFLRLTQPNSTAVRFAPKRTVTVSSSENQLFQFKLKSNRISPISPHPVQVVLNKSRTGAVHTAIPAFKKFKLKTRTSAT